MGRQKKEVFATQIARDVAETEQIVPETNFHFYHKTTKAQDGFRTNHLIQVYEFMISKGEIKGDSGQTSFETFCRERGVGDIASLFAK